MSALAISTLGQELGDPFRRQAQAGQAGPGWAPFPPARPSTSSTANHRHHPADIQHLLRVLGQLVDPRSTVVVIEHNVDVVKTADYVDIGQEGGSRRPGDRGQDSRGDRPQSRRLLYRHVFLKQFLAEA